MVETTQLPPRYEFEGTEVSKELFEELSRESDPGFVSLYLLKKRWKSLYLHLLTNQ